MPHPRLSIRAVAALLLTAALALTACGGDEPSSSSTAEVPSPATPTPAVGPVAPVAPTAPVAPVAPAPPESPGVGIQWIEGFAKGVEAAKSEDDVLFVYVGRRSPT